MEACKYFVFPRGSRVVTQLIFFKSEWVVRRRNFDGFGDPLRLTFKERPTEPTKPVWVCFATKEGGGEGEENEEGEDREYRRRGRERL
jgi:hypothetical protein